MRYAFLKVPRLQLPNKRVSFGTPSYVGRGHRILPPTSPLLSNRSIAKILWTSGRAAPAGETLRFPREYNLSSGITIPVTFCRTAAEASAAIQRRRHGRERDCTPGAELPDCRRGYGGSLAAVEAVRPLPKLRRQSGSFGGVLRELNCGRSFPAAPAGCTPGAALHCSRSWQVRQAKVSAAVRQLRSRSTIPFSMSRFMDFRESRAKSRPRYPPLRVFTCGSARDIRRSLTQSFWVRY